MNFRCVLQKTFNLTTEETTLTLQPQRLSFNGLLSIDTANYNQSDSDEKQINITTNNEKKNIKDLLDENVRKFQYFYICDFRKKENLKFPLFNFYFFSDTTESFIFNV